MSLTADVYIPTDQRPIRLRRRTDLVISEQVYRGERFWLIKDPLELQFYRLNDEEYSVLEWIDGDVSLEEIRDKFERKFSPQRIKHRQLQTFVSELRKKSLLIYLDDNVGPMLVEREQEKKQEKIKKTLTSILSLKWRGVDPDRFLGLLVPKIGWIFSTPLILLGLAWIAMAGLWLLVHYNTFVSKLPGLGVFLAGDNWSALGLAIVSMKIVHELAHGLAFKRFGGECHEIGVLLMMGIIPTLYCSTTDSWLLKNKWQRAAIGAAGMYVELLIAATATFLWWFSTPGTLNMVCLNIMATGTISVVLLNGNPFFKFDGYYIFSDITELPNLHERAGKQAQATFMQWGLGIDEEVETNSRSSTKTTLVAYSLGAFVFKVVFLLLMKFMLIDRLTAVGLGYVGLTIGLVGLVGLFLPPLFRLYQFFEVPGRLQRIEMKNSVVFSGLLALVSFVVFMIPFPHDVTCGFTTQPHDGQGVYVEHEARLVRVHVQPGQRVRAGDLIAELENVDKRIELGNLEMQIAEEEAERELIVSTRDASPTLAARLTELEESLRTHRSKADQHREVVESYRVVADRAGVVIPEWTPERPEKGLELVSFDGSALNRRNVGAWIPTGQKLATIGELSQLDAVLAINEHDVSLLEPGQPVWLMVDAGAGTRLSGTIDSLARQETENLPGAMAKKYGGGIEIESTAQQGESVERPADEHYEARVSLPVSDQSISSGLRGQAKIRVGSRTLYQRVRFWLHRSFREKL